MFSWEAFWHWTTNLCALSWGIPTLMIPDFLSCLFGQVFPTHFGMSFTVIFVQLTFRLINIIFTHHLPHQETLFCNQRKPQSVKIQNFRAHSEWIHLFKKKSKAQASLTRWAAERL